MKKYSLLLIIFPFIGLAQTYTVVQQPTYGLDPKYTPTTYTVKQTAPAKSPNYVGDALTQVQNNIIQTQQINAQIESERNNTKAIIENQNRIENLRIQEQRRSLIEQQRIKEENNPNSILNKFKNADLKKENEDLKNKLMKMELLLAEKDKAENDRAEKERLEKERIEKEVSKKKTNK
ncbi:hypothetical protein [Flavobacterium sp.]|uniref:hypothetical protein n=1 Tax=Flavobacterium sp. TaxID=239 RepID=UPI00374CA4E0